MKHTQGKWEVLDFKGRPIVQNDKGIVVAETFGNTFDDAKANARLIASAPKLLEACKLACSTAEMYIHSKFDGTKHLELNLKKLEPIKQAIKEAEK